MDIVGISIGTELRLFVEKVGCSDRRLAPEVTER
jgi:hypothetical protein